MQFASEPHAKVYCQFNGPFSQGRKHTAKVQLSHGALNKIITVLQYRNTTESETHFSVEKFVLSTLILDGEWSDFSPPILVVKNPTFNKIPL